MVNVGHGNRERTPSHDTTQRPRIALGRDLRGEGVPQTVEIERFDLGLLQRGGVVLAERRMLDMPALRSGGEHVRDALKLLLTAFEHAAHVRSQGQHASGRRRLAGRRTAGCW